MLVVIWCHWYPMSLEPNKCQSSVQCAYRTLTLEAGEKIDAILLTFSNLYFIWIQISLKFVPEAPIRNKSAFVEIFAWHWKQWLQWLPSLLKQYAVSSPQRVNSLWPDDRAGVKYVLSNTNTNTNTKIWIFQIQIQIFSSTLIQIQIQIHRFKYKYKYKYVQPNTSAETVFRIQNRAIL